MTIVFIAGAALRPVLQKYFEGLLDADGAKKLGEAHRKAVRNWLVSVEKDISRVLSVFADSLNLIHTSFTVSGKEKAILIEIPIGTDYLYVVLNHKSASPSVIANLPKGIVLALSYLGENGLPKGSVALQLYFDDRGAWRYLFAPSVEAFGSYIDRFVDLVDGEIKYIDSSAIHEVVSACARR